MITLLTPTGGRPEAFALCEHYMSRQSVRPDQWIVVDDCEIHTTLTRGQVSVRVEPFWEPGQMTLPRNIKAGLETALGIGSDVVIIIEDDDWYHPDYIKTVMDRLNEVSLAGEGKAKYYNVRTHRSIVHRNTRHASLCQTAFRSECIPEIINLIDRNPCQKYLDLDIWKLNFSKRVWRDKTTCVGIKGMPGRGGIGYGHDDQRGDKDSQPFRLLKEWIGTDDARVYENFCNIS